MLEKTGARDGEKCPLIWQTLVSSIDRFCYPIISPASPSLSSSFGIKALPFIYLMLSETFKHRRESTW